MKRDKYKIINQLQIKFFNFSAKIISEVDSRKHKQAVLARELLGGKILI